MTSIELARTCNKNSLKEKFNIGAHGAILAIEPLQGGTLHTTTGVYPYRFTIFKFIGQIKCSGSDLVHNVAHHCYYF